MIAGTFLPSSFWTLDETMKRQKEFLGLGIN
jgi:hypothetical protein